MHEPIRVRLRSRPGRLAAPWACLALLSLAACGGGGTGGGSLDAGGGGGGGGGGGVGVYGSLTPKGSFTQDDARHFLERTHWGATDATVERLDEIGLTAFVDEMLEFPALGTTPWEQDADLRLVDEDDPVGQVGLFPSRNDLIEWWIELMVHNPNTFQEVLAFFWHDHFATSTEVLSGGSLHWMKNHINLFREKGAGDLRELVLDVSRDWSMLRWLDGISNKKQAPNENFAREFFELFCLGVDNGYTQDDIVNAAAAFTGYREVTLDQDTGLRGIEFDRNRHRQTNKVILGQTIASQNQHDDYAEVVDITFDHANVAEWFAQKLLEYFCYENPPAAVVGQLAQILRSNDYELKPALRALFRSQAFYSVRAKDGQVMGPVGYVIGFMRSTGLMPIDRNTGKLHVARVRDHLQDMAQVPTMPPGVNGWPTGELWLSAQAMVNRANFLRECIVDRDDQADAGIRIRDILPEGTPTSAEVVDTLAGRLGVDLEPLDRDECMQFLDTRKRANGTLLEDPFAITNNRHVDERVRGLLYILGQHPSAMIR